MQILCFGDSITWGEGDTEGGWADRLRRLAYEYMENNPDAWVKVYNLGIPGDRTDGLLRRFENETQARVEPNAKPTFLFAFGANDSYFINSEGRFRCPVDEFEANYRKVIAQAKQWSDSIILLTITPVDEEKRDQSEKVRKNEFVEKYNEVIKRLAAEEQLGLIDVNQAYLDAGYKEMFGADGLHPNSKGHELIFSLVKERVSFVD